MAAQNMAAWLMEPKGRIVVKDAPMPIPDSDEVVTKNEAFAIQPLDASILKFAYFPFQYPLILGNNVAGTITGVGSSITKFTLGDRVVSDTPMYVEKANKYGGWQKYVTSKASMTCTIPNDRSFEDATAMSFSLLTAVAALSKKLGMPRPPHGGSGKVLVWGASGSVGGYAVQYASQIGFTVHATASPAKFEYVKNLGAHTLMDYRDAESVNKLRALGPYDYVMSATGNPEAASALGKILQPQGGKFVHLRPRNDSMDLPENVELLYESFSLTTSRNDDSEFTRWWYDEYFLSAIANGIKPTPVEKRRGGLNGIEAACNDVVRGVHSGKLVLNARESL